MGRSVDCRGPASLARPIGPLFRTGPLYVSHLTLHNFRSYADVDVPVEAGVTAFIGRNGQGKTNLVEAIDYLSRLSSHRVATDAPLVRAGSRPGDRAGGGGQGRTHRGARGRAQPRPGQPGTNQQVDVAESARPGRPGAHRHLLARGPHPGQGRPLGAPPLPRRPAGAAHSAARRHSRRLRPGAQATQLAAEVGSASATGSRPRDPRRLGCEPRAGRCRAARRAVAAGRRASPVRRPGLRDRGPRCGRDDAKIDYSPRSRRSPSSTISRTAPRSPTP